jgi:hypothetical protein
VSAKKKQPARWRYQFPDGTAEPLTFVEAERARLRTMARMLQHPAASAEMRERGEALLEELAQLLAAARAAKIGSDIGTLKRRAAGDRKAELVTERISRGADPLDITSERNLRRIKGRKKK